MLSDFDKSKILEKLPNIELSMEKIIYKKVFDVIDYYILIPQGKRSLLWFTHYNKEFLPIILFLDNNNKILDLKIIQCCFNDKLALNNSIFLGTFFNIDNYKNNFFSIDDIIYFDNNYIYKSNYNLKFKKLEYLFNTQIKQINFNENSTIIGLPKICENLKNIDMDKFNLIYKLKSVTYINKNWSMPYGVSYYYTNKEIFANFKVKPDIQNDIYYIYLKNENNYYDILLINSYNTSVFMNNLFRKIKENKNLDLLEESDSENEFENTDICKYVNLEKEHIIKCKYSYRFKKWVPLEINKDSIISRKELYNILKK